MLHLYKCTHAHHYSDHTVHYLPIACTTNTWLVAQDHNAILALLTVTLLSSLLRHIQEAKYHV